MEKSKINNLENIIIETLKENNAINIVNIDLEGKSDLTEKIIIASGTSNRHILTLKDKIADKTRINKFKVLATEGEDTANWIVIDLSYIMVHLFREEVRDYYQIEEIWQVE